MIAYFGGGCFWCTESAFQQLKGVKSVTSGYSGGFVVNPTYEQVSSGSTGHAEVSKIEFDPSEISFDDLLSVLFVIHDPTTPNRQGNDIGSQYRSIILYTDANQKHQTEEFIKKLSENEFKDKKIVTELKPFEIFYEAEDYHKNYYQNNPEAGYCRMIINPKLEKLKKKFSSLLK